MQILQIYESFPATIILASLRIFEKMDVDWNGWHERKLRKITYMYFFDAKKYIYVEDLIPNNLRVSRNGRRFAPIGLAGKIFELYPYTKNFDSLSLV